MTRSFALLALALSLPLAGFAAPVTVDFEDLGAALGAESFVHDSGGFNSGGVDFANDFTDFGGGCCFSGWLYSNKTDDTTPGFTNDQSAIPGSGSGSDTYGVAYLFGDSSITFDAEHEVQSGDFTNTTYAALSMATGDTFAKKFGGVTGDDPDWFLLEIRGYDAGDTLTGTVALYLADFRFADNSLDFILDTWTTVDLTSLGAVKRLDFAVSGSDVGPGGLNTPSYFALDDLVITPEPGTGALLALGLVGLAAGRRR